MAIMMVPCAAAAGEIAVIVHKDNPVGEMSLNDVIKIFKKEKKFWPDQTLIYFVSREAGSPEREVAGKAIYKMDDRQQKRFWLSKIYTGDITAFPRIFESNQSVKRFVSRVPAAVGFIDPSYADDSVKVLKIDGKLPGDAAYPLKTGDGDAVSN